MIYKRGLICFNTILLIILPIDDEIDNLEPNLKEK